MIANRELRGCTVTWVAGLEAVVPWQVDLAALRILELEPHPVELL